MFSRRSKKNVTTVEIADVREVAMRALLAPADAPIAGPDTANLRATVIALAFAVTVCAAVLLARQRRRLARPRCVPSRVRRVASTVGIKGNLSHRAGPSAHSRLASSSTWQRPDRPRLAQRAVYSVDPAWDRLAMQGWGQLLIKDERKRRVGSPVFLFAVGALGLLPLLMIPSAIGLLIVATIGAWAFGVIWMWNRQPWIEAVYEAGIVVKLANGRRYARWRQVDRIERKLMRTPVYFVHLSDVGAIKVVPAADGFGTARQIIDEIVARAGLAWSGTTARPVAPPPPS